MYIFNFLKDRLKELSFIPGVILTAGCTYLAFKINPADPNAVLQAWMPMVGQLAGVFSILMPEPAAAAKLEDLIQTILKVQAGGNKTVPAFLFALGLAASLSACGTIPPAPKTPDQAAYELRAALSAAEDIAIAYGKLPDCTTTAPASYDALGNVTAGTVTTSASPICRTAEVLASVKKAAAIADIAITAAETAARTPGYGEAAIATALASAEASLSAFKGITATLGVK